MLSHFPAKTEHQVITIKMASKMIAEELLSLVSPYNYWTVIPCLTTDDFMPLRRFQTSILGNLLTIDKTNCVHNGIINNDCLFSMFGKFSEEDADSVRTDAMERIKTGERVYTCVGQIFFARREITFKEWALMACSQNYYGDELLLFVLCRVFHCHAIVVCYDRYWTTLEPEGEIGIDELLDACDLHLVFLCPGVFGELKLKKKFGRVRPKTSPPEFLQWASDHMSLVNDNDKNDATAQNDSGADTIDGFKNSTLLSHSSISPMKTQTKPLMVETTLPDWTRTPPQDMMQTQSCKQNIYQVETKPLTPSAYQRTASIHL